MGFVPEKSVYIPDPKTDKWSYIPQSEADKLQRQAPALYNVLVTEGVDAYQGKSEEELWEFEAKLKTAVEGGILGEGVGLTMKGGSWVLKKTKDRKALRATAEFLMNLAKAARRTNETQVAVIESDASEIIANHLLEQYDAQRAVTPEPADVSRGTDEGESTDIKPKEPEGGVSGAKDEGAAPAKPEEKKPEPTPAQVYTPNPEVREAYAQYALTKILKDDMTSEEWMKSMKGKGHPKLLQQSYDYAMEYIEKEGKKDGGGVPLLQLTPGVMAPAGKLLEVEGEND